MRSVSESCCHSAHSGGHDGQPGCLGFHKDLWQAFCQRNVHERVTVAVQLLERRPVRYVAAKVYDFLEPEAAGPAGHLAGKGA
jgi:hypothetical protein